MSSSGATVRTPLLVRLPNWVGDVCMALPTLQALDALGFDLRLIGKGWAADLLAGHGWATAKIPAGIRAIAVLIRQQQCHQGVLLTNSLGSAMQARWGGVRAVGYRGEGRSLLLGRGIPRLHGVHEVERFWRLAREMAIWRGLPPLPIQPPARLGLQLSNQHREQAVVARARQGVHGPYTVLCPLAVGTIAGRSKCWSGFPALARQLSKIGRTLVVCPGPGEDDACREAAPGARVLSGLSLGAYAAICAEAQLTIANDSGPMHLAAAVDAPVLGIFGVADPQRTRPWSVEGRTLGDASGWPSLNLVLDLVERS